MPPSTAIEVPHVEDAPPRLAADRKCLFQQLVEHFLERCAAPVLDFLQPIKIAKPLSGRAPLGPPASTSGSSGIELSRS